MEIKYIIFVISCFSLDIFMCVCICVCFVISLQFVNVPVAYFLSGAKISISVVGWMSASSTDMNTNTTVK